MKRERIGGEVVAACVAGATALCHVGCGWADGLPVCATEASAEPEPGGLSTAPQALRRASFDGIGDLPGGEHFSQARDVDAHGMRVVGVARSAAGTQAVSWTREAGLVALAEGESTASGISDSGCVVVGSARTLRAPQEGERALAARWGGSAPPELLPEPFGLYRSSEAIAVSGDGQVIIGLGQVANDASGFVWRGTEFSNAPPDNYINQAASEDGSVVVGVIRPTRSGGPTHAIRNGEPLPYPFDVDPECTEECTPQCITPGQCLAAAYGVSADGSVIVGTAEHRAAGGPELAVQWTAREDDVTVTLLSSGSALARAVSADGRVIVGSRGPSGQSVATRWVDGQPESVAAALEGAGVSLGGWQLTTAMSVSADGRSIVGAGLNPDGNTEGWVARLPGY